MKRFVTTKQKIALERGRVLYRLKGINDLSRYQDSIIFTPIEKEFIKDIIESVAALERQFSLHNIQIMRGYDNAARLGNILEYNKHI